MMKKQPKNTLKTHRQQGADARHATRTHAATGAETPPRTPARFTDAARERHADRNGKRPGHQAGSSAKKRSWGNRHEGARPATRTAGTPRAKAEACATGNSGARFAEAIAVGTRATRPGRTSRPANSGSIGSITRQASRSARHRQRGARRSDRAVAHTSQSFAWPVAGRGQPSAARARHRNRRCKCREARPILVDRLSEIRWHHPRAG